MQWVLKPGGAKIFKDANLLRKKLVNFHADTLEPGI